MPHKLSKNNSTKYVDTVARGQYRLILIKRRASRTLLARARTATAMARSKDSASIEAQSADVFCVTPNRVDFVNWTRTDGTNTRAVRFALSKEETGYNAVLSFASTVRGILREKGAKRYVELKLAEVNKKCQEKKIQNLTEEDILSKMLSKMQIVIHKENAFLILDDIIIGDEYEKKFEEINSEYENIFEKIDI